MAGERKILTLEGKQKLIDEFKICNVSKAAFSKEKGIARTTVRDILVSEKELKKITKRENASVFRVTTQVDHQKR